MLTALRLRRRVDALLAVVDVAAALLGTWLAYRLRFEGLFPLPARLAARYFGASLGVAVASVVTGRAAGLYRRSAIRPGETNVEAAVESGFVIGAALLVVDAAVLDSDLSRAWIGLVTLFVILGALLSRAVLSHGRRALVPLGIGLERYAVVGAGAPARRLIDDLARAAGAPFEIVATFSPELSAAELRTAAETHRVEGLVLPVDTPAELVTALAGEVAGRGIEVLVAPRLGDLEMRVAQIVAMQGVPLLRLTGAAPRRRAVRSRSRRRTKRRVAILGTRGIPANYGGFETFAERLAEHLQAAGDIDVTVYCRRQYSTAGRQWRGIRLVTLPTLRNKYLDTVVHTALSTLHLILRNGSRDVVLCNAANAPVLPLLRIFGRRVVMNVDGLEWRRGKWGVVGRSWYRIGEWLSVRWASVLVTDADEVRTYYRVRHDRDSVMIPYGADLLSRGLAMPDQVALAPDSYCLYVSRWERENNPLLVATAHAAADCGMPLVMLGQATYDHDLGREVKAAAADAVLPGPIFGAGYQGLQSNARCYIHATEVGGTHPALIEAMGAGNLCLVLDTPENREVAGPDAWYFADQEQLSSLLRHVASLPDPDLQQLRAASRDRAATRYSWSAVGEQYLELLIGAAPS